MSSGRFAPSPSGDLHVGNLRTALLAWLFARSSGRGFRIRMEDLDRVRPGAAERQLADLARIGLDWDGEVVWQSHRRELYRDAVAKLRAAGETYECYCTRREIQAAPSAPHGAPGAYPGTCRHLSASQRAERRASGRPPALRLRAGVQFAIEDALHGQVRGLVDDMVLVRGDGVPAYNLAVVVDDADMGIDQVVRGDDLLSSAPRQAYLAHRLGLAVPDYVHVPMAIGHSGQRLAKRDGAITLSQLAEGGISADRVLGGICESLGLPVASPAELLAVFDPARLPRDPWLVGPSWREGLSHRA